MGDQGVDPFLPYHHRLVNTFQLSPITVSSPSRKGKEREINIDADIYSIPYPLRHLPSSSSSPLPSIPLTRVRSNDSAFRQRHQRRSPTPTSINLPLRTFRPSPTRLITSYQQPAQAYSQLDQPSPTTPIVPTTTQGSNYFATLNPTEYQQTFTSRNSPRPSHRTPPPPYIQPGPSRPSPKARQSSLDNEEILLTPPASPTFFLARTMSSASSSSMKRKVVIMGAPSVGECSEQFRYS